MRDVTTVTNTNGKIDRLIVPLDGSAESWRGFDAAVGLALRLDAEVRVVQVVYDPAQASWTKENLDTELVRRRPPIEVSIRIDVRTSDESVASEVEQIVGDQPESVVVMSSHGRGRSAAIVGSVAKDLLERALGPLLLVGPEVVTDDFAGPITVTVDGSDESEAALAVASTWARALHSRIWIIHVVDPSASVTGDVSEGGYPARLANELRDESGLDVEFDVLHHVRPGRAVVDDAGSRGTALIVASSRGASPLSRFVLGSVTAEFVRHAPCPVLVVPSER